MARTILITGGSSGLGLASARELAKSKKNHLVIASRNPESAVSALINETGNDNIIGIPLNLASLDDIRRFVIQLKEQASSPLYAIICNAGITLASGTQYSEDRVEKTFAVNHLGRFLLVNELIGELSRPSRVIVVSSGTHIPNHKLARRMGTPVPNYTTARGLAMGDKADEAERVKGNSLRYTTSKLCNVLFAYELARKLNDPEVGVFAMDPGLMPDTNFTREFPAFVRAIFRPLIGAFVSRTPDIRLSTTSGEHMRWLVESEGLVGKTAVYFDGNKETNSSPVSYELDKAKDLWDTSVELTGVTPWW